MGYRYYIDTYSGKRYLAHETAVMSLTCTAKVWLREIWNEWKGRVFG